MPQPKKVLNCAVVLGVVGLFAGVYLPVVGFFIGATVAVLGFYSRSVNRAGALLIVFLGLFIIAVSIGLLWYSINLRMRDDSPLFALFELRILSMSVPFRLVRRHLGG